LPFWGYGGPVDWLRVLRLTIAINQHQSSVYIL